MLLEVGPIAPVLHPKMDSMDFCIETIRDDQIEDILEFLREHFFPNEPCAKALNLCPHGYRIPTLEDDVEAILNKGLSQVAVDRSNGKILGVIIGDIKTRDNVSNEEVKPEPADEGMLCRQHPETFKKLLKFFSDLTTNYGNDSVFNHVSANRILDIFIVCTWSKFAKQGLATAMFEQILVKAKSLDFKAAQCMALSHFTGKICRKFGFKALFRVEYQTYQQSGEFIFNTDMGEHNEGILYVKTFE